ncbi:MAG: helix-turn-helix transcriptional regulator [Alphaproteobacteria bacterium]|nr:helix-turn-helix transcriptional regulator [Alphaproteobacteria bacterium]
MTKSRPDTKNLPSQSSAPAVNLTTAAVRDELTLIMRSYMGYGQAYSIAAVADAVDIDQRTMKSYADGDSSPTLATILRLFRFLGPEFANRVLAIAGFGGCIRVTPEDVSAYQLNSDASALVGALGHAFRHGHFDNKSEPEVIDDVRKLAVTVQEWLAERDQKPSTAPKTVKPRRR